MERARECSFASQEKYPLCVCFTFGASDNLWVFEILRQAWTFFFSCKQIPKKKREKFRIARNGNTDTSHLWWGEIQHDEFGRLAWCRVLIAKYIKKNCSSWYRTVSAVCVCSAECFPLCACLYLLLSCSIYESWELSGCCVFHNNR